MLKAIPTQIESKMDCDFFVFSDIKYLVKRDRYFIWKDRIINECRLSTRARYDTYVTFENYYNDIPINLKRYTNMGNYALGSQDYLNNLILTMKRTNMNSFVYNLRLSEIKSLRLIGQQRRRRLLFLSVGNFIHRHW